MVTRIEAYRSDFKSWVSVGDVLPGQRGSMSNNLLDGRREIYLFECATDDSHTTVKKMPFGVDIEMGNLRAILQGEKEGEVLAELKRGDKPYIISIKTDVSPERRMVRFSHQ